MRRAPLALGVLTVLLCASLPQVRAAGPFRVDLTGPPAVGVGTLAILSGRVLGPNGLPGGGPPFVPVDIYVDGSFLTQVITGGSGLFSVRDTHAERGVHAYEAVVLGGTGTFEARSAPARVAWVAPPGAAPAPVLAPAAEARAFTATWGAPADDGGAAAFRMRLYVRAQGAAAWTLASTATTRTGAIGGLAWDTPYEAMAREENVAGLGAIGAITPLRTPAPVPPGPMGAPTLRFDDGVSPTLNITWSPPADRGNGALSSYRVERSVDGGAWTLIATTSADAARAWTTPVGYSRQYAVRVTATTSAGEGAAGASATLTTPVKNGLELGIQYAGVCQTWHLNLYCSGVEDGETIVTWSANLSIEHFTRGTLHVESAPVSAPVDVVATLAYADATHTATRSTTSDANGAWSAAVDAVRVPRHDGACRAYSVHVAATALGGTRDDTLDFTVCATGGPPP